MSRIWTAAGRATACSRRRSTGGWRAETAHWTRYRLEAGTAAKRKLSGQLTWWFGSFYDGSLDQIELEASWKPIPLLTLELSGERNIGRLTAGDFTTDLVGTRMNVNVSPDLQISSFIQYDTESRLLGSNSRLRWSFSPLGELFVAYNHNLREFLDPLDRFDRFGFGSNQLLVKVQYAFRY